MLAGVPLVGVCCGAGAGRAEALLELDRIHLGWFHGGSVAHTLPGNDVFHADRRERAAEFGDPDL